MWDNSDVFLEPIRCASQQLTIVIYPSLYDILEVVHRSLFHFFPVA